MDLLRLRTQIFDSVLAIQPSKFDIIIGAIGDRLGIDATLEQLEAAAKSFKSKDNSYALKDGIAIIPVTGSLMKKTSGLMAASGNTSYEAIGKQFKDALADSSVKGVLLDIDSPGGSTQGLFELAEMMSSVDRGGKPVYAISDDGAYSAAYAIASCADKIYLTQTAGVGSIGVFCAHVDQSSADTKAGLKYSFIKAGAKKTDGNTHEALSSTALADTQAEVDRQYGFFVSLVAKNRGVSVDAIKATEAGVFFGENAIPLLADAVGTSEDAFNDIVSKTKGINGITNALKLNATVMSEALKSATESIEALAAAASNIGIKANINNIADALTATHEEEKELTMAKSKDELTIDELVTLHATKAEDDKCEDDAKAKKADVDPKDDDEEDDDDEDKKKDDAKKATHADAVRIVNLCSLANMSAAASDFLAAGYTVSQVEKALLKHRAGKSKEVKIASANTAPVVDNGTVASDIMNDDSIKDKAAAFKKHLMKNPKAYLQTMLNRDNGENYTFLKHRGF